MLNFFKIQHHSNQLQANNSSNIFSQKKTNRQKGIQLSIQKAKDSNKSIPKLRLTQKTKSRSNSKNKRTLHTKYLFSFLEKCNGNIDRNDQLQINFDIKDYHNDMSQICYSNNHSKAIKCNKKQRKLDNMPSTPINKILFLDGQEDIISVELQQNNQKILSKIQTIESTGISSSNSAQFLNYMQTLIQKSQ